MTITYNLTSIYYPPTGNTSIESITQGLQPYN